MPDYKQSKIYKIESKIKNLVYYGSTTSELNVRMRKHKYDTKKRTTCTSKLVMVHPDAIISLVENFPCESRKELHRREGHFIRHNECVNKMIPGRTGKEWRKDNKEIITIKQAEKYRRNPEPNKKRASKHYLENKAQHYAKAREWHFKNLTKVKAYHKEYHEKNKVRAKLLKSKKVTCDCGRTICRGDIRRHLRSARHIKIINAKIKAYRTQFNLVLKSIPPVL